MDVELRGITKRFGERRRQRDVNLTIRAGEVLGLLGENGAGKSTLMNVLSGLYRRTQGEILIDGKPVVFRGRRATPSAAGIGMVHQHFMLVPVFTVAENVVLGVEPTGRFDLLDLKKAREQVREISRRYGLEVDPDALIEDLPVGIQQRVEIIKVLFRSADVLIFDEPTAVLTPQEVIGLLRDRRGRCARPARRSSSSPTSSTRCWRSPTGSACCAAARSSAKPIPEEPASARTRGDDGRPAGALPSRRRSRSQPGEAAARGPRPRSARRAATRSRCDGVDFTVRSRRDRRRRRRPGQRPDRAGRGA